MKNKQYIAVLLIVFSLLPNHIYSQKRVYTISQVLEKIQKNNKDIRIAEHEYHKNNVEQKMSNNMDNPEVEYANLWSKKSAGGEQVREFAVNQSFDFPTKYASRRAINKKVYSLNKATQRLKTIEVLLKAKEICLDMILLQKQKQLLEERMSNANELRNMYEMKMKLGDASIIDLNKIKLEQLNVKAEQELNSLEISKLNAELKQINGGEEILFEATTYDTMDRCPDYEQLKNRLIESSSSLQVAQLESIVARKNKQFASQWWLPKLALGYRMNNEAGVMFRGITIGVSIPIFEERGKRKVAKLNHMIALSNLSNTKNELHAEMTKDYEEVKRVEKLMKEYLQSMDYRENITLLYKAVNGGEISMIEYFSELSQLYEAMSNYNELENRHQKAMARLLKNELF